MLKQDHSPTKLDRSSRRIATRRGYFAIKRVFDLLVSASALVVLGPVLLLIGLAIRLNSPGPALFRQTRIGRDGQPFTFFKFRSMYVDADPKVHERYVLAYMRNEVEPTTTEAGGGAIFKLVGDPRVTRVGHFLRETSLDELPQLLNVLRGEMSLVGPRPPLPYEVAQYEDWHRARLTTVPGITGWWQVWGRCQVSFDEMVRMDLTYIERQSLWLDLKILFLTLPAVVRGQGAA